MKTKDLKKMRRSELLEILVAQSEEIDRLKQQLAEAEKKEEERNLSFAETGNLAELAAKIGGLFEAAQKTADVYVETLQKACADQAAQTENTAASQEPAEETKSEKAE